MAEAAFSLCVYLGSRPGNRPLFVEAAQQVGRWIGEHQGQLVYGGGNSGLMGVLAQTARAAGGRVVGVIPQALVNKELANHACDELHVVATMHERKAMMAERSDAFLAIPGGIGTLEELFEIWTWRQLGYHDKPVGVLDAGGYYAKMLAFLRQAVDDGLMSDWQMQLVRTGSDPATLLQELVQEAGLPGATKHLRSII
ncbi:TIGR00730 family Rossman fold protein [Comamonas flocculans]|uniref:Cytokinin riboside 5'-monophosphate phosphoribohydrolase n=1 Tax=Comamonas flocculans TaxID=2597701 RepID=A0A5B8RT91_9BURK|nr:TIGR00730 family Rossman fold protein [Comamonas flocculans]QEA11932.1 TIGR00730 family Rossman fold protein [Comamonas flocculans]